MGFAERLEQHNSQALPLVHDAFDRLGYQLYPYGGELVPDLQKALRALSDPLSKMLRYRPDLVAVHPHKETLLLEVKSESRKSPNFAVEYDAWEAAKIWNQHTRNVLYVFVDLAAGNLFACWPETLHPEKVYVSRLEDELRLANANIKAIPVRFVAGSGTAFFLVSKQNLNSLEATLSEKDSRLCGVFSILNLREKFRRLLFF